MRIRYVSCFEKPDRAEAPLIAKLQEWEKLPDLTLTQTVVSCATELHQQIVDMETDALDVLIVGGHGHKSRSGFWVGPEPLRWQDLAFLLRGKLSIRCSFIFYSCDGGYPGISHVFGRVGGPDYVFGPRISVDADAMAEATHRILEWKLGGAGDVSAACQLVDDVNAWARSTYFDPNHHEFLRVMWCEGPQSRYPNKPGPEKPIGEMIKLRGWGLSEQ